jgi:hypothetical protein
MRTLSLLYSLISSLYIAIAIPVFFLIIKNPTISELGIIINSPLFFFPIIGTFLSGYISFLLKIRPWLLGLIHFLLAHLFVLLCYLLLFFSIKYSAIHSINERAVESLREAIEMILLSLIGGIWIFPGFVILSYFLRKKLLPL